MKKCVFVLLALLLCSASSAQAVDFTAKGQWLIGVGAVNSAFITEQGGKRTDVANSDTFAAVQRLRLRLTAVASESLSGVVWFEIGDTTWGQASSGGALGADGKIVEVKSAYIDWTPPNIPLKTRMGIQPVQPPSAAGGPGMLPRDVAAIVSTYRFNDTVALTALWARPFNDNFGGLSNGANGKVAPGFLDNVDYAGLILPITLDGLKITPWAMLGGMGKNSSGALTNADDGRFRPINNLPIGMLPYDFMLNDPNKRNLNSRNMSYSTLIMAGLPIVYTGLDGWNFELDLNYASSSGFGRYDAPDYRYGGVNRGDTRRQGWLAKALIEYKLDWGTPGIFGWYSSGDDGDVTNGSERMPTMAPTGDMTSFMGDGPLGWSIFSGGNLGYDLSLSYSGTWAIGAQLKDLSFVNNLKHTVRAVWWGGTNSPEMVRHLGPATAMNKYTPQWSAEGIYLTRNDALVEINVDSTWKVYDNLDIILELGYIANLMDTGTWERSWMGDAGRFSKGDAYKAALIFAYNF